jgi:maltose alpha-D-glucosyltransferase/alpha-amylase
LRRTFDRGNLAGPRRLLRAVRLREWFRLPAGESAAYLLLVDVEFNRGSAETLVVPIAFASEEEAALWPAGSGPLVWARLAGSKPGVLYDALSAPAWCDALLEVVNRKAVIHGSAGGEVAAWHNAAFSDLRGPDTALLLPAPFEQTNRLVRYGNRLILKAYRRIEEGVHCELELGRLLADVNPAPCVAPLAGSIEYRRRRSETAALAIVHGYVPNEGDGLQYSLDVLSTYFEHVTTLPPLDPPAGAPLRKRLLADGAPPPQVAPELLQGYLEMINLLGKRLGQLHLTLASASDRPEFIPEPITLQYQRALYQSMRNVMFDVLNELQIESHRLPDDLKEYAVLIQKLQPAMLLEFRGIADRRIHAARIRCHGDCHLHQVLFTGKDFVFIDFEGRPRQSVGERRIKRSPFVDVTMMVRSFDYAAYAALYGLASGRGRTTGAVREEDRPALLPWSRAWRGWTHHAFLEGWIGVCEGSSFLPSDQEERNILFRVHLVDQILQEISRQLRSDPAWLPIPLLGLLETFEPVGSLESSPATS